MVNDSTEAHLHSTPDWLVDWLGNARRNLHRQSLAITGPTDKSGAIARKVARYLNEFDSDCDCNWRPFDRDLLQTLAYDSSSRRIVLAGNEITRNIGALSTASQIAQRIASLGGVVLSGAQCWEATADLKNIFRVSLHPGTPPPVPPGHISINLDEIPVEILTSIIADSFLGWRSQSAAMGRG